MNTTIKHISFVLVFGVMATLVLFGTGYADWGSLSNEARSNTGVFVSSSNAKDAMSSGDRVTLSGTIDPNSHFVDYRGDTLKVSDTDTGLEVQSLIGQRVEIKGTVMDEGGQRTVEVHEYQIFEDIINDGGRY